MRLFVSKSFWTCIVMSLFLILLSSCSDDSYLNVVPKNSMALVSVDAQELSKKWDAGKIEDLLEVDDMMSCGIDFSSKIYAFETIEGNIGVVAKVSDESALLNWLDVLLKKGHSKPVSKYKDYFFTVIKDSWVVGFSSDAAVLMGPALPSQQFELRRQIVKCFEQDEDDGIKSSPMFCKLDSISAPVSFVAQSSALPDKFIAPFTIGAPKDADRSQIMIAAELVWENDDCLVVHGETFSFNKSIDRKLKESHNVFRPIKGVYVENTPSDAALSVFMNVDGGAFLELLHSNKSFQALLAGLNTAIDMDNIIKSIDGDMAFLFSDISKGLSGMQMAAQLRRKDFLADIDYWKQSCPVGSRIINNGKDAYCFKNNEFVYYFGVIPNMQFYVSSTDTNRAMFTKPLKSLSDDIQDIIDGQRMVMVIDTDTMAANLKLPLGVLLGDVDTILYIMK